ncbi:hypothetical protein [Corynebacterium endometrii]|uniref:Uncharacterized protein n=1 Tax=Corynebacterium endometrii TaxID=2488819 RepID=A0A4P7QHG7_9CORY|nr:hypothetical protein [Corynebacterium endometrii]QCB28177.1 hypothetical protein CENDO_04435 [Corynebacterium endometrii]
MNLPIYSDNDFCSGSPSPARARGLQEPVEVDKSSIASILTKATESPNSRNFIERLLQDASVEDFTTLLNQVGSFQETRVVIEDCPTFSYLDLVTVFGLLAEKNTDDLNLLDFCATWFEERYPDKQSLDPFFSKTMNRVAFLTRYRNTVSYWQEELRTFRATNDWTIREYFISAVLCERFRFAKDVEGLHELLVTGQGVSSSFKTTALGQAIGGYARLLLEKPTYTSKVISESEEIADLPYLLKSAIQNSKPFETLRVRDLVLSALDEAPNAQRLAGITVETIKQFQTNSEEFGESPQDPLLLLKLARAYRRSAQFDAAYSTISIAMSRANVGTSFSIEIMERILQERTQIIFTVESYDLIKKAQQAAERMEETESRVNTKLDNNTLRSTEVLALFSSAVAFAVGAASIGSNQQNLASAVIISGILLIGLVAFSGLIFVMTRNLTDTGVKSAKHPPTQKQRERELERRLRRSLSESIADRVDNQIQQQLADTVAHTADLHGEMSASARTCKECGEAVVTRRCTLCNSVFVQHASETPKRDTCASCLSLSQNPNNKYLEFSHNPTPEVLKAIEEADAKAQNRERRRVAWYRNSVFVSQASILIALGAVILSIGALAFNGSWFVDETPVDSSETAVAPVEETNPEVES